MIPLDPTTSSPRPDDTPLLTGRWAKTAQERKGLWLLRLVSPRRKTDAERAEARKLLLAILLGLLAALALTLGAALSNREELTRTAQPAQLTPELLSHYVPHHHLPA